MECIKRFYDLIAWDDVDRTTVIINKGVSTAFKAIALR